MTDALAEEKTEKTGKYIYSTAICVIAVAIVIALLWRIQCSISYYDEVLNIYISYITAALGQRHLVENGYIFSMGDLFNLPFVYLFWRVTGGTEGLLLFIRFVYLGFNLGLSLVFWKVFGKYYGKKVMLLFGLILITFFPGGMYTVSYDTVALFFSLLGGVLLLGSEIRGNDKTSIYRYFAGICHACMVYSYPLMAGVIVLLMIGVTFYHICNKHMRRKELFRYWFPYFCGGMTVFGIFFLYVMYVGWENVIFFQEGYIQKSLYGRQIGEFTAIDSSLTGNAVSSVSNAEEAAEIISDVSLTTEKELSLIDRMMNSSAFSFLKRIGLQIFSLLNYMWIQQKAAMGITMVMLVQWGIGLARKGKWRLILIPEILLVAFLMHREITCFGGTTMYAYCFCWAPFLLFYLEREDRRYGNVLLLILGLISVASFLAIGFTSVRTDKAHVGLYCGAICTFLLMVVLLKNEYLMGVSVSALIILLIAMCNTGMAYIDHFQGADIKDCTYRMQKGFFKGMMTWEKDIQYENLKAYLEQRAFDKDAFLCMTDYNYYAACLDGGMQTKEGNFNLLYYEHVLQTGGDAEAIYVRENWPEVILIDRENADDYRRLSETILVKFYDLALLEEEYFLYMKR